MFLKNSKGFAFIDFILGVVILGIAVVPVISILLNLRFDNNQVWLQSRAVTYANSIMHQIRAHRFDEATEAPWTLPGSLGSESSDGDDVDDFIGANWSGITGFSDFSVSTDIYYVNPISPTYNILDPYYVLPTNYKKIDIIVNHPNLNIPVGISSLVTPLGFY
ncbi:MAG: hypothetical protein V3U16_05530 [Candidatus Neomarinimicrobiota bacterium]